MVENRNFISPAASFCFGMGTVPLCEHPLRKDAPLPILFKFSYTIVSVLSLQFCEHRRLVEISILKYSFVFGRHLVFSWRTKCSKFSKHRDVEHRKHVCWFVNITYENWTALFLVGFNFITRNSEREDEISISSFIRGASSFRWCSVYDYD